MVFVFEVVRHGARSPLLPEPEGYFQVPKGMLTSQGMRQRYLLGAHNRQRYIYDYWLLDSEYNPKQFQIMSTKFPRVTQSSYAELLGLYPPNEKKRLSKRELKSLESGKGLPKIQLRVLEKLKNDKSLEIFDRLTLVPVFNYMNATFNDDIH